MTTINPQVSAGANDGHWGKYYTDDSFGADGAEYLELWVGNRLDPSLPDWSFFARFVNVTVPAGATIDVAYLTLRGAATLSDSGFAATIWAADADNPAAPTTYTTAEGQTRTTATVAWTNPSVTDNATINTPDISAVIQEIVDRAGWTSGNAMVVCAENNGSSAGVHRMFDSYEAGTSYAPILHIEYTEASSGITGSLSVTLGAATMSAAGAVGVTGDATPTLAAVTLSSAGNVSVSGQLSQTLSVSLAAAGAVSISGAASVTLTGLTIGAAGQVSVTGAASNTLDSLTLSASGLVDSIPAISGAADIALASLTVVSAGVVPIAGNSNTTLTGITLASAGSVAISGGANVTLGGIAVEAAGAVTIQGSLTAALGVLTLVAAGFGGQLHTIPLTIFPRDTSLTLDPRDYGLTLHARGLGLTLDERDNDLTLRARTNALTLEVK